MRNKTELGRYKKRKKPNHKITLLLLIILIITLLIYMKMDTLSAWLFNS